MTRHLHSFHLSHWDNKYCIKRGFGSPHICYKYTEKSNNSLILMCKCAYVVTLCAWKQRQKRIHYKTGSSGMKNVLNDSCRTDRSHQQTQRQQHQQWQTTHSVTPEHMIGFIKCHVHTRRLVASHTHTNTSQDEHRQCGAKCSRFHLCHFCKSVVEMSHF